MMRSLIAIAALVAVSASADVNLTQINNNEVADATKVMDNFNALANEVNSQDARITIVEQSVGGGTTTRTFTFNGWVDLISSGLCSGEQNEGNFVNCNGLNGLNLKCKAEFGGNYSAANLEVLGEALKYGVQITFPTTGNCGLVITDYTDPATHWWTPLSPYIGTPVNRDNLTSLENECGDRYVYDVSLMCGYWD